MLKIEDNNIYLTKGDTATINIDLYYDGEPWEMQEGDKISLAIKRNVNFNNTVFSREYSTTQINLLSSDTSGLSFGDYEYSLTYIHNDENIDTFLIGKFIITETAEE